MGNRKWLRGFFLLLVLLVVLTGCIRMEKPMEQNTDTALNSTSSHEEDTEEIAVTPSAEVVELENGFSVVRHDGDDGFDGFLSQGGASSDGEVVAYLAENLLSGLDLGDIVGGIFGCSTIASENRAGEKLFGRNFDWENCEAMIVASYPENGYASLSTVNMDFITQNVSGAVEIAMRADEVKTLAALYAPLDGMNEAGLAVSVNMIQDSATISQDTGKHMRHHHDFEVVQTCIGGSLVVCTVHSHLVAKLCLAHDQDTDHSDYDKYDHGNRKEAKAFIDNASQSFRKTAQGRAVRQNYAKSPEQGLRSQSSQHSRNTHARNQKTIENAAQSSYHNRNQETGQHQTSLGISAVIHKMQNKQSGHDGT